MDAASVSLPAGRDWIASNKRSKSASASQVIPSKYFDRVFDRFRHLDQLKVFHRDASQAAEFFDPTHPAKHECHQRPEAPAFNFNRQVETGVRASGAARAVTAKASARGCSVWNRTATKSHFVYSLSVANPDPKLEGLLKAERLAFERYDRLRGYPADVQGPALALWTEATEAVREYRSKHP
jgi:hypothetical protein